VIKSISVFRRKPGVSAEAFAEYRLHGHANRMLAIPRVRRYLQSHRIDERGNAPYDGFDSLWFDDEAAAGHLAALVHGAAAVAEADAFLDKSSVRHFLAREIVMRDLPATPEMVKVVFFFHRKRGMSPAEFRRYWLETHGPLAMKHITAMRRYIQNHTLDAEYAGGREPDFDGLVEAWLDDLAALEETEASEEHAFVRSDEPNFLDVSRVTFMPVREYALREP
jgi:uncharacterized protein (TIGR02118 family)